MHKTQKALRTIGVVIAFVIIGSYAYTHMRNIFLGPNVSLESPVHGSTVQKPLVEIKGTALRTSSIEINDAQALIEENGSFEASLLLSLGYNIIEIEAEDRFGRESVDYIEIIYKPT